MAWLLRFSATLDHRARGERPGRAGCRSPVLAERDHRRLQSRVPVPPGSLTEELQTALTAVARAVAESLELREVWGPVADACRAVVPFDGMGVSQFQGEDRVVVGATAGDPAARGLQERVFGRTDFSPRLWPRAVPYLVRIEDASAELDRSFLVDRELVGLGFRSILRLPLVQGDLALGSLVLVSRQAAAFSEEHGRRLAVVADLVTLALAHERLVGAWRERRRRRDAFERLVPALTGTLDVREVFEQISRIAQEVIPHDYLSLGLLTEDRKRVRMIASFGTGRDTVRCRSTCPARRSSTR